MSREIIIRFMKQKRLILSPKIDDNHLDRFFCETDVIHLNNWPNELAYRVLARLRQNLDHIIDLREANSMEGISDGMLCPHCIAHIIFKNTCEDCEYKKVHGNCNDVIHTSDYSYITNTLGSSIIEYINLFELKVLRDIVNNHKKGQIKQMEKTTNSINCPASPKGCSPFFSLISASAVALSSTVYFSSSRRTALLYSFKPWSFQNKYNYNPYINVKWALSPLSLFTHYLVHYYYSLSYYGSIL